MARLADVHQVGPATRAPPNRLTAETAKAAYPQVDGFRHNSFNSQAERTQTMVFDPPDNDIPWRAHSAAHTGSLVLVLRPGTPADRCAWCRCGASCPLGTDIVGGDEHRPCGGAAVRVAHTFVNGELFADPLPVCATHLPALRAYVEQLPGKSDR